MASYKHSLLRVIVAPEQLQLCTSKVVGYLLIETLERDLFEWTVNFARGGARKFATMLPFQLILIFAFWCLMSSQMDDQLVTITHTHIHTQAYLQHVHTHHHPHTIHPLIPAHISVHHQHISTLKDGRLQCCKRNHHQPVSNENKTLLFCMHGKILWLRPLISEPMACQQFLMSRLMAHY